MKILHILNSNKFSGAENVVCQIIDMFKDDSDIEMIYCSPNGQIEGELKERRIDYVSLKKMSIVEIRRVLSIYKPDIIHTHDMRATFVTSLICGKIPLVAHIHNNDMESRRISLKSLAFASAALKAKHIFWVSGSAYNGFIFKNFFLKKSSVLYNVISVENIIKKKEEDTNQYEYDVVYCGRLTDVKDPLRLIEICALLAEARPNIRVAIIGDGEMKNDVIQYSNRVGLQKYITFLGYKSNPLKIMSSAKCMIITSKHEGTPMVALEALALGIPIITTPVDGMVDLIKEGYNGYFATNNYDFVHHINELLDDKSLQERLSQNARNGSIVYNNILNYKNRIRKIYMYCMKS